jgi:hypothetical protein
MSSSLATTTASRPILGDPDFVLAKFEEFPCEIREQIFREMSCVPHFVPFGAL